MIIQGSNNPIVLEFDSPVENITDLSALLSPKGIYRCDGSNNYVKHWRLDDVQKSGRTILLPLTQNETLLFNPGRYELEVKWVENDNVIFARVIMIQVEARTDRTQFELLHPGTNKDELVHIKMETAVILNGHSPYINEETLTWMVYDDRLGKYVDTGINASPTGGITVDSELSLESENPVQNKVITEKLKTMTVDDIEGAVGTDDLTEITAAQIDDIWDGISI